MLFSLSLGVASCTPTEVPMGIVKRSIVLQLEQTQALLSQELRLVPPQYQVQNVDIQSQKPFSLDNLATYRLRGEYRLTLTFPHRRVVQDHTPFEIYLQEQAEGESWRLAIPTTTIRADQPADGTGSEQRWQTYRVE
ncbi:MAG: hypothetical protein AAGF24_01085 [Cyanobacteria bacterium P01_H01_bin.121]